MLCLGFFFSYSNHPKLTHRYLVRKVLGIKTYNLGMNKYYVHYTIIQTNFDGLVAILILNLYFFQRKTRKNRNCGCTETILSFTNINAFHIRT